MTKVILEQLTSIEDLALFSNAFKKGKIQVNITKILECLIDYYKPSLIIVTNAKSSDMIY